MSRHDPKRAFAVEVVRRLKQAGYEALWAGGCVRDFLLGHDPEDYDVATDARPEEVRQLFGKRRTLAVGASFGVIIVLGPNKQAGQVEVATFRSEGPYLDGRHPEHVAFTNPQEDARRRDFTINGMFYDPVEQTVLDYVGGERDLGEGIIRAIGEPQERMQEDKLRLLRAVRFTATFDFQLDPNTAEAVRRLAPELCAVSAERIAQELRKMLCDGHRMRAVQLTADVGLLRVILPELASTVGTAEWSQTLHMLQLLDEPGFELAMAVLLHSLSPEQAEGVCRRLRLSNQERAQIGWLIAHQHALDEAPRLPLAKLKRLLAEPLRADLLKLVHIARIAVGSDPAPIVFCEEFLNNTPPEEINPPALITGNDLIAAGLQPGPQFKQLLEMVRDAQLNGEIHSKDEALALVDRLRNDCDDRQNLPENPG